MKDVDLKTANILTFPLKYLQMPLAIAGFRAKELRKVIHTERGAKLTTSIPLLRANW
ncbi:hypothetical protein MC7420_4106 [Coleofasciculus chthonoplastes PCC 7420]|uniref:Uncharacterized protein n=1 Tax=Coleofasciculus chthonoplastes PCC 7420 TaxID=118168 RepID=B4VV53_9CYAN|nr:hypothetical protein MC7420_4106 [Coleofasciculus chthonoplastes PCC 7420]